MVAKTLDDKVDFVLAQIETMVASEGGTLELVSSDETSFEVKYVPGVNEECPECVPTHDQVRMFMKASLSIHAPQIKNFDVT